MDQRKLIKLGNSSFAIALPKDWVDKSGLKKGDNVFLEGNSNGEIILWSKLKKLSDENFKEIKIDNKTIYLVKKEIVAAYTDGSTTLILTGKKEKSEIKEIKEFIKSLLSFEIIEENSEKIVAKDFFNIEEANLNNFIKRIDNNIKEMFSIVSLCIEKGKLSKKELDLNEKAKLEEITVDAPVSRIVATIIKHAVETKSSDIHIEPFEDSIRLRFRVDGVLQAVLSLPKNLMAPIITRIKILSEMKIDETRIPQDGRFSTKLDQRRIDFRVSTLPTRNGEKAVLRILDPLVGDINLIQLGLEGRSLELMRKNIAKPFGSILITGPTGSGKSTTLAAILREINDEEVNIITLEDPIEYYVEGVNQSQIHEEVGYTFASGLRHILRQDPDIIMVGEIRDGETAALATQAALTGHLVFSTLHTNDTIGIVPRLVNMDVEPYLIAPTLNLGLAQRLLRKLCNNCKVKVSADPSEETIIKKAIETMPADAKKDLPKNNFVIYKPGDGCNECNKKTYKGRIAIFETLEMTDQLERIILGEISEELLRREAKRQGMLTMFQDGIIKILHGVSSLEELFTIAQEDQDEEESKAPIA